MTNFIKIFSFLFLFVGFACEFSSSEAQSTMNTQLLSDELPVSSVIVPGAERIGLYRKLLTNKKVAIVVNQASRIGTVHLLDTLLALDINVVKVFAPEHGFRGKADRGEHVGNEVDKKTGIPIISLYGKNRKPREDQMKNIDYVVFDLQDVGVRFYTYISTLHNVMEACSSFDIPLLILDRPNPNGFYVDGPVLDTKFNSFVGMHPVPIVYGLTIGEYGNMINGEQWLSNNMQCNLEVIECLNYDHSMTYDLPIPPSPNLPNLRSILLYPSLCLMEPTVMSVGRGTQRQFQIYGTPDWPNKEFEFIPVSSPGAKHPINENKTCFGVDLTYLGKYDLLNKSTINLTYLIDAYSKLKENKFFTSESFFDKLAGSSELRIQLKKGISEDEIRQSWEPKLSDYKKLRKKYLLYKDFE